MAITSRTDESSKTRTICIDGTFDFNQMQAFRSCYDASDDISTYELDFSGVEYMDSSALGMLLNMRKTVGEHVRIVIRHVQPVVAKILAMSRFDKKFEIVD